MTRLLEIKSVACNFSWISIVFWLWNNLFLLKVFGSRVRVESTAKVAELELAEKVGILFHY